MTRIDGLILAAGLSSRMGAFKPLLTCRDETFVAAISRKLATVCDSIFVVTGHRADDVRAALRGLSLPVPLQFTHNEYHQQGMFSSLQAGIRSLDDTEWLLCHWVDQPHLPANFYAELVRQIEPGQDCIQPVYRTRKGHPLLLGRKGIELLNSAPAESTLRDALNRADVRTKLWSCSFQEILDDFDKPEDLIRLNFKPDTVNAPPKAPVEEQRADARDKLEGRTRYIRDEAIADLWHGVTVRSPHARARIVDIRLAPEFDWSGVCVVTARDVPHNIVELPGSDMPFVAGDVVNYVGEAVALVAAPSRAQAEQARAHIEVVYETMTPVDDMLTAESQQPPIFAPDNVFKQIEISKGDLTAARANADATVEVTCTTGYQEHLYLEPQGIVAVPQPDRMVIRGSMQCPYYIHKALKALFDGTRHIQVVHSPTGGAFGGKEDFPSLLAGHAALLAGKCGNPVAMFYERAEDVLVTTKRHPSHHSQTAHVARDGRLLGLDLRFHFDGGAYCTLSPVVLARGALAACGSYYSSAVNIQAKAVATNHVPSGAFRGFGGPQSVFAMEMLMEQIALDLGLSPARVREINLIRQGQLTATEQELRYSVSAVETWDDCLRRSDYDWKYAEYRESNRAILQRLQAGRCPKQATRDMLRGIGVTSWLHGASFTGTGENRIQGRLRLSLTADGRPVVSAASTEMGQGQQTAFQLMTGMALGIDPAEVIVATPDTDMVPDTGPTAASRTTMIAGALIVKAAAELVTRIAAKLDDLPAAVYDPQAGGFRSGTNVLAFRDAARRCREITVEERYQHPPEIQFDDVRWKGDAYPVYAWGAAVAEVEVDPVTFEARVTKYTTTQDIGKAINRDQTIAQIQGGTMQGIGYALYERIGAPNGRFDATGFTDYIIPTTTEMPDFDIRICENPYPFGPFGAKGLGELPFVGAAPAVVSALWMIFERPFTHLPVLPEDMARLFAKPKQGAAH